MFADASSEFDNICIGIFIFRLTPQFIAEVLVYQFSLRRSLHGSTGENSIFLQDSSWYRRLVEHTCGNRRYNSPYDSFLGLRVERFCSTKVVRALFAMPESVC